MRPIDRYEKIQQVLVDQGRRLELALVFEVMPEEQLESLPLGHKKFASALRGVFKRDYRAWHGNASALIRQLEPKKHEEFLSYYLANSPREALEPFAEDLREWLTGTAPEFYRLERAKFLNGAAIVSSVFSNQLRILESCRAKPERPPVAAVPVFASAAR